jgi:hypothetical protein
MRKTKSKEEIRQEYLEKHLARIKRLKSYHRKGLVCVPKNMFGFNFEEPINFNIKDN